MTNNKEWPGNITKLQAIKLFDQATDRPDPAWEYLTDDFYDEDSDTMPTIYQFFAALGITEKEYKEATGCQNLDWPNTPAPVQSEEDKLECPHGRKLCDYVQPVQSKKQALIDHIEILRNELIRINKIVGFKRTEEIIESLPSTNEDKVLDLINRKFKSGNSVEIDRIIITRKEFDNLSSNGGDMK